MQKFTYLIMAVATVASITTGWARDEIVLSELDRSKSKEQRDAFTDWISGSEWEIFYEQQKQKGAYLIYVEGNGKGEYRGVFGSVKPNGWYYNYAASLSSFLQYNRQYESKGFKLMTLSKARDDTYGVVWVHKRSFDAMSAQLANVGISLAKFSED
jgi:hypothetical protein